MTSAAEADLRAEVVRHARLLTERGLAIGTSGNVSVREPDGSTWITPASMDYAAMTPDDIVVLELDGAVRAGHRRPSSETPLHLAVYAARPTVRAIVHAHSPFATTWSTLRRPLPAVHYVLALLVAPGGAEVRCAEYATFGTEELARNAVLALGDDQAVLLANHGAIAVGTTSLAEAFTRAERLEEVAMLAWRGQVLGGERAGVHVLTADELDAARAQMANHPTQR